MISDHYGIVCGCSCKQIYQDSIIIMSKESNNVFIIFMHAANIHTESPRLRSHLYLFNSIIHSCTLFFRWLANGYQCVNKGFVIRKVMCPCGLSWAFVMSHSPFIGKCQNLTFVVWIYLAIRKYLITLHIECQTWHLPSNGEWQMGS